MEHQFQPPRYPEGSKSHRIWQALQTDTWLSKIDLCVLSNITQGNISPTLTDMRRTGWIECQHIGNRQYEWRRRVVWAEPQPDVVNRSKRDNGAKLVPYSEPTVREHLEHARHHISKAWELVGDIEAAQEALMKVRAHRS